MSWLPASGNLLVTCIVLWWKTADQPQNGFPLQFISVTGIYIVPASQPRLKVVTLELLFWHGLEYIKQNLLLN